MACTPCTAPTSHAAWSARSYVPKLLAHRAWNPPPSSLAEKERLRSLLLRATTRDSRRSQLLSELLAHRARHPPPSPLAEETTPPLAPPPCDDARFPTLPAISGGQLDDVAPT